MKKVSIQSLVSGLREIPEGQFLLQPVFEFLERNPIDISSLEPYIHWSESYYTRNLIYRDERFELLAICWRSGQFSKIHDHAEQLCWMTVPFGKLRGQNYLEIERDDSRAYCKLVESESFDLSENSMAAVEIEQPIHQILNLAEFNTEAISIHIYSKPIDSCLAFCDKTDTYQSVKLAYTSVNGKLEPGTAL